MEFEQKKRKTENDENYHIENLRIAREFSKHLIKEMNELVKSVVLFGSNTHDTLTKESDIDLMIVLDNVSVFVSAELREAYRIISTNLNQNVGKNKVHVTTINLSDLWDMARKGDPLLINILRYGSPLFDRNLVEPLQYLLETGKIRPSKEAIYNYTSRADTLLEETQKHIQEAVLDLYYCIIDIVHATLMVQGVTPPSPKDMPKIFKNTFNKNKELAVFSRDIEEIYTLTKKIEHNTSGLIKGSDYDKYKKKAEKIVSTLKKFNHLELKKKDPMSF